MLYLFDDLLSTLPLISMQPLCSTPSSFWARDADSSACASSLHSGVLREHCPFLGFSNPASSRACDPDSPDCTFSDPPDGLYAHGSWDFHQDESHRRAEMNDIHSHEWTKVGVHFFRKGKFLQVGEPGDGREGQGRLGLRAVPSEGPVTGNLRVPVRVVDSSASAVSGNEDVLGEKVKDERGMRVDGGEEIGVTTSNVGRAQGGTREGEGEGDFLEEARIPPFPQQIAPESTTDDMIEDKGPSLQEPVPSAHEIIPERALKDAEGREGFSSQEEGRRGLREIERAKRGEAKAWSEIHALAQKMMRTRALIQKSLVSGTYTRRSGGRRGGQGGGGGWKINIINSTFDGSSIDIAGQHSSIHVSLQSFLSASCVCVGGACLLSACPCVFCSIRVRNFCSTTFLPCSPSFFPVFSSFLIV